MRAGKAGRGPAAATGLVPGIRLGGGCRPDLAPAAPASDPGARKSRFVYVRGLLATRRGNRTPSELGFPRGHPRRGVRFPTVGDGHFSAPRLTCVASTCFREVTIHESRFSRVGVTAQRRHELCGPSAIPRDRRFASAPRGNNALCPSSPLCAGLLRHFSAIWRSKSNHGVVAAPVEVPGDAGQGGPRCVERPKPSRPRVCAKG